MIRILLLLTTHRHVAELGLLGRAVRRCCPRLAAADALLHTSAHAAVASEQLRAFSELLRAPAGRRPRTRRASTTC